MNSGKIIDPLEELGNAISDLEAQSSLTTKDLVARFYVERESKFIKMLKTKILFSAKQPIKILFSGHIGSGKSSELFKLKKDLDEDFLVIYYSIKDYMNFSGINISALMETIATQLIDFAGKDKIIIEKGILDVLENWKNNVRLIKYRDEKRTGRAGVGGSVLVADAKGEILSEKGAKTEMIREQEPDINDLIKALNSLIKRIQEVRDKELIIIIDDIDKVDLADAEELFLRYSRSMTAPACKIIYTVPISLLYSLHYHQFESFYNSSHLLPISKVRKKDGSADEEGINDIRRIVAKRISTELFAGDVLKKIIMASGGIIRDVIRIIQGCCLICVSEKKNVIDETVAKEAIDSVKNEFLRQIPKDLYDKLIAVKNSKSKRPDVDQELQRLLYCLGVLEYINSDTWYEIHPLTLELVEEKERERLQATML
ncbi:MAG: AAA family ATPase [bacterium]|nr:AAA family ATPase [bacterium]